MRAPSSPVIDLAGVSKRYGRKTVVHDVHLGVGAGECVALLGHNGAGKTTLMKLMLGLTRPSGGRLRVLGVDPADAGAHVRIGYLPENVVLYDAMTGREVLTFFARLKREPVGVCGPLLDRVGLAEAADRRVRTYSKGMRQRLGLAQALLGDPALLLLDEPTTGLDPALRRRFYDIIGALRDAGATVLISSHALTEIEARADRLAILKDGRLTACGTLDELRRAADLPVRIRVLAAPGAAGAVAEGLGGKAELRKVNDRSVDLTCLGGDKMDVIRRIAGLGAPVQDLEIIPPGLEEIYTHFTGEARPR